MPFTLSWDDGTGRMIEALYETEAEAHTQAAADEEQFPGRADSQVVQPAVEEPAQDPGI